MPENAITQPIATTNSNSGRETPVLSGSLPKPVHLSSFPPYEVADSTRTSTPEPIKVVRSKKKTGNAEEKKKKKRHVITSAADT